MPFIYALCEPDGEIVRYVGKTKDMKKRMAGHRNEKRTTRKCRWLAKLSREGQKPVVRELEKVPDDVWEEGEQKWIAHFRALGCDLCNHTDGGEGRNGMSAEERAFLSELNKKRMADPVHRAKIFTLERAAKISAGLSGQPHTKEHIANLPQNRPGRKISEEHKRKLLASLVGNKHRKDKPHTPETKAKISAALKGNKHTLGRKISAEERAARSVSQTGRQKSEEHKEKIRLAQLRAWARRKAEVR